MGAWSSAPATGAIVEFRSVVDAVRCAIEVQNGMVERNAGLPPERRIQFRIGIHLGDVVEESDGDLMGDGVNIAARLEGIATPGTICLSEQAYWQVKSRLDLAVSDLGSTQAQEHCRTGPGLFARSRQAGAGEGDQARRTKAAFNICAAGRRDRRTHRRLRAALGISSAPTDLRPSSRMHQRRGPTPRIFPSWCCLSGTSRAIQARIISLMASPRTSPPISRASATAS